MNFIQKKKLENMLQEAARLHQARKEGKSTAVDKEIDALLQLAKFYDEHRFDKDLPNAEWSAIESFRDAGLLGDIKAQYQFARRLFDKARFWDDWAHSIYGNEVHVKYARAYYDEAFVVLKDAQDKGFHLAKRLRGLAYFKGWGVDKDISKGLDLITESIDEQGAWDRSKEIVETIGLEPQEFFSALKAHKDRQATNKNPAS